MTITIVRELPVTRAGASQALVKTDELIPRYYVVSTIHTQFKFAEPINETLVFPSDHTGKVTDRAEVAGYEGASREDALNDLANRLGATLATDAVNQVVHGRKFRFSS